MLKASRSLISQSITMVSKGSRRSFSAFEEPPYGVNADNLIPPAEVTFPYFSDKMKKDMYELHKSDPGEWNVEKLSNRFRTSIARATAVLFMMKNREKLLEEKGLLNIPENWQSIWNKYSAEPTPEVLAQLAQDFELPAKEVKDIVDKMTEHHSRLDALNSDAAGTEKLLLDYSETFEEADVSFREVPEADTKRDKFTTNYFPRFVADEFVEEERRAVLRRIAKETLAVPDIDLNSVVQTALEKANNKQLDGLTNYPAQAISVVANATAKKAAQKAAQREASDNLVEFSEKLSRFKIAFKDISKAALDAKMPTMIRTRSGAWRVATPLEELGRSWVPKPHQFQMVQGKKQLEVYEDPDGDDHLVKEMIEKKRLARKALKATAEGKK